MYAAQSLLRAMSSVPQFRDEATDLPPEERRVDPFEVAPRLRGAEMEVAQRIEDASMTLSFSESPTASALAGALAQFDRESRRTVRAFERGVSPRSLFGRGVRLKPLREGLVVEDARPGSLDVSLLLGGLYTAITSQPLSFALNLAALVSYSRATVRALLPDGKGESRDVAVIPREIPYEEAFADGVLIHTPHEVVFVPASMKAARIDYETRDGSKLSVEFKPPED